MVLLAAKLEFVEAHVETLTHNGLRPIAIDAVATALARRAEALSGAQGSDQTTVWIDAGHDSTKVLIVRQSQVLFFKTIEIGTAELDLALAGALKISADRAKAEREAWTPASEAVDAESDVLDKPYGPGEDAMVAMRPRINELGREIGLCLRYFGVTFRGARPEGATVVGGNAVPWFIETLSESVGVPLVADNPLQDVDLSAVRGVIRPGQESAWAVAAGLSLRQQSLAKRSGPPKSQATDDPQGVAA